MPKASAILLIVSLCIGCAGGDENIQPLDDVQADVEPLSDSNGDLTTDVTTGSDIATLDHLSPLDSSTDTEEAAADTSGPPPDNSDTESIQPTVWGPEECPALPPGIEAGYAIGQQIEPMTFQDCDGSPFPLENFCGADVTWLFFAHAWCGDCQTAGGVAEAIQGYFADHNVATVQIVVHSIDEQLPTAVDCGDWKALYALEEVYTLYDPFFSMAQLIDTGQTGLSVLLDGDRIIRRKLHVFSEAELIGEIQALLTEDEAVAEETD